MTGWHHRWQQFTMWPRRWSGPTSPYCTSSTHMPRWIHRGWPMHYLDVHPLGMVGYLPSRRHTTLVSLGIPYVPYVSVHFNCLFNRVQPMRALIDIGRGYHLWALNFRLDHSPSFPSSILHFPLITPLGLQLYQPFDHLAKPHRTSMLAFLSHRIICKRTNANCSLHPGVF
jgi:hypothetical protein